MSKTIVSLFPSTGEAQLVKQKLVEAGYSSDAVRIVTNQERSAAATASGSSTSTESGFAATISNFFKSLTGSDEAEQGHYAEGLRQGGALVSVTVADGQEQKVADWLESYGGQDVADQSVGGKATSGKVISEGGSVPIVQEEMLVGKKLVDRGGVRVYSHLVETPVEEAIQLRQERVQVDRRPTDRPATEADFNAFKEGTIELTETAEEAVVSKSARVVEEVVVGKTTSQTTQTIRDRVRHTEVEVEQLGTKTTPPNSD